MIVFTRALLANETDTISFPAVTVVTAKEVAFDN